MYTGTDSVQQQVHCTVHCTLYTVLYKLLYLTLLAQSSTVQFLSNHLLCSPHHLKHPSHPHALEHDGLEEGVLSALVVCLHEALNRLDGDALDHPTQDGGYTMEWGSKGLMNGSTHLKRAAATLASCGMRAPAGVAAWVAFT
jgi:hypothetical protein